MHALTYTYKNEGARERCASRCRLIIHVWLRTHIHTRLRTHLRTATRTPISIRALAHTYL